MDISLRDDPRYNRWLVFGLLAAIYCLINLVLPRLPIDSFVRTYVIQPILWGLLAWAILVLPRYRSAGGLRLKSTIIRLALMIGFFQVLLYVIGGLFSSFGKSPYSFAPTGILTNLVFIGSMLVGMELSRAWLINRLGKKHTLLAVAFVAVLYTLLSLPLARITGLRPELASITYVNSTVLPTLAESMLASFLALLGGPLAAIAYRGILQAFWWFCPILPDLPWAFKGLIGVVVPIVGLLVANTLRTSRPGHRQARRAGEGSLAGWVVTTIVAVAIIWFAVGLFPVHPTTVISGSMRPTLDVGDVIIVAKVPADTIEPGDIIQFREAEGITTVHRVVEFQEIEGNMVFITQGDANRAPDPDPVLAANVVGKVIFNIPKVGWAAIAVKEFFTGQA
ncbi:MAG TPA: signal peptidase I [Dehalococcoidia bacterium]|nr:signal peptidase I [Dehalococcoidia bacterium]